MPTSAVRWRTALARNARLASSPAVTVSWPPGTAGGRGDAARSASKLVVPPSM